MPKFYLQNQVCGQQTYTTFRQVVTLKTTHHIHMWHSVKAAVNLKPPPINAFITRTIILGQKNPQRFGEGISLSLQMEREEKGPILVGPQERGSLHHIRS